MIGHATLPLAQSPLLPSAIAFLGRDALTVMIVAAVFTWGLHSSVAAILLILTFAAKGHAPGARYGLISAAFVVFTLVITDFGLPKVIGGQYGMLAVDIYKQVIGQQNFEMGAVVSVILLVPAILAFAVDRHMQRRQVALLSARALPYAPKPNRRLDGLCFGFSCLVSVFILGMIAMCQIAAIVKFWPYDLTLTTRNFAFDLMDGGGWSTYGNSIKLALLTALFGSVVVFAGAYMVEKAEGFRFGRSVFHFLAMMPMAVPGMVLGLAYIFFFNNPGNPLSSIYGTMTILVVSTVTHFYTVAHLTALTALKQMDPEFESVAASLKQPFHRLFFRVTVPVCLPAILNIAIYLFVNDDDGFGGSLPLCHRYEACFGCRAQHGRCGRHRTGSGDGHDDLLYQRGCQAHPCAARPPAACTHASLAVNAIHCR